MTPPERYGAAVDALRPGMDDPERRLRCGILWLRDRASAGMRVATWEAGLVLGTIVSLGTTHGFAPMPDVQLEALHHALVRLMAVATDLQTRGSTEPDA